MEVGLLGSFRPEYQRLQAKLADKRFGDIEGFIYNSGPTPFLDEARCEG
jgi:hypothetical protein